MKSGTCPKCSSAEIYLSDSPYPDPIFVKSNRPSLETFTTCARLCLDCGHLEIYFSDTSVGLFGKGKLLRESIPDSSNWEKSETNHSVINLNIRQNSLRSAARLAIRRI